MNKVEYQDKVDTLANALMVYINQKTDLLNNDLKNEDNDSIALSEMLGSCRAYENIIRFILNYFEEDTSYNNIINEHIKNFS